MAISPVNMRQRQQCYHQGVIAYIIRRGRFFPAGRRIVWYRWLRESGREEEGERKRQNMMMLHID